MTSPAVHSPAAGSDALAGALALLGLPSESSEPSAGRPLPERIEVTVGYRHIRAGVRGNGQSCPIALALRDAGYQVGNVGCLVWTVDGHPYVVDASGPAYWFVRDFDEGRGVHPERFVAWRPHWPQP